jgi:hypothetical protein
MGSNALIWICGAVLLGFVAYALFGRRRTGSDSRKRGRDTGASDDSMPWIYATDTSTDGHHARHDHGYHATPDASTGAGDAGGSDGGGGDGGGGGGD